MAEGFEHLHFFGGSLCTKRKYRTRRPLSTKHPIHLVLRSSQALGTQSFLHPVIRRKISHLLVRLGRKWGIEIVQFANVGNHLHLLIKIKNLQTYKRFICALTGAIARIVPAKKLAKTFWDYRPYSRIVYGLKGLFTIKDYILINQLEGTGTNRELATILVKKGVIANTG